MLLKNISIVTNEEAMKLLHNFNSTPYEFDTTKSLVKIFEEQVDINPDKTAIIFEGEKSVLKYEDMYDCNIAVASCGSNLNYRQIELLVKDCEVNDIIIAYDKEFKSFASKEGIDYYNKLRKICCKYSNYCNFYFLFDYDNLLELKDSPIDKGKKVFETLMKNKIQVRLNNDL